MKEKLDPLKAVVNVNKLKDVEELSTISHLRSNSSSNKISLPPLPSNSIKATNDNAANPKSKEVAKSKHEQNSDGKERDASANISHVLAKKKTLDQQASNKPVLSPLDNSKVATDLTRINIKKLVDTIKPLIENNLTPLILDQSERCDIFFQYSGDYSGIFVEAKKLVVEVLVFKKKTLEEALEELRKMLVAAMKFGRTLVIRMTDTCCDFLGKFNHPDYFPAEDLFVEAGQRFKKKEYWSKVVRAEDLEHGQFVVRDEFCLVISSTLEVEEYADMLKNAIPVAFCAPIFIEAPTPAPAARTAYGI